MYANVGAGKVVKIKVPDHFAIMVNANVRLIWQHAVLVHKEITVMLQQIVEMEPANVQGPLAFAQAEKRAILLQIPVTVHVVALKKVIVILILHVPVYPQDKSVMTKVERKCVNAHQLNLHVQKDTAVSMERVNVGLPIHLYARHLQITVIMEYAVLI